MTLEPVARQLRHHVQSSGLFEEMRCSRHDPKLLFAAQLRQRCPVQLNDLNVIFSDDKQRAPTTSGRKAAAASAAAAPVLAPK